LANKFKNGFKEMLMKKGLILLLCVITSLVAVSQNIQDAKKFIYYERYKSAEDLLQQIVKTDPANAEGWYLLTKAYLSSDNPAPLQNILSQTPAQCHDQHEPVFFKRSGYQHGGKGL
jgi:thioredoxin-like negative regulator of GroEL